ncbi:MAG: hypothetical protein HY526_10880 [Betaproteobacteria bacterium]|nr:hypothetical protein [Betaproteobacteria bacterium]
MRKTESKYSLVERIEQLDLSTAEKRVAIENALRGERVAELLHGVTAGLGKLADAVIVRPVRRGVALFSR